MTLAERLAKLPRLAQRSLAASLIPIALLAAWGVTWPLRHAYAAQRAWRQDASQELAEHRGLAAIAGSLRAQLDALTASKNWQQLYPASAQDSGVRALQIDVDAALSGAGARPQTITALPVSRLGPLRKLGLRIEAVMNIEQLTQFLVHVAALTRFARIERLLISAPPLQSSLENPQLLVTLEIHGYAFAMPQSEAADTPSVKRP